MVICVAMCFCLLVVLVKLSVLASTDANRFFTGKKNGFLPVKNPLPFLPVKYKFYQLISVTKITLKK